MQFSHYNKFIAAFVLCALSLGSLAFHADLGVYADMVTVVLTALTPAAVYLIPNVAKKVADGGDFEKIEDIGTTVANELGGLAKPT